MGLAGTMQQSQGVGSFHDAHCRREAKPGGTTLNNVKIKDIISKYLPRSRGPAPIKRFHNCVERLTVAGALHRLVCMAAVDEALCHGTGVGRQFK